MGYRYNQLMFRKFRNKDTLINFIFYRPDIEMVVYDSEGAVYQCYKQQVRPAKATEIFNYYEAKINLYKKRVKHQQLKIKEHKLKYVEYMKKLQELNIEMKRINDEIFGYKIMDAIVDKNLCEENLEKVKAKQIIYGEIQETTICNYRLQLRYRKDGIKKVKELKQEIGRYKNERKKILEEGIYIEDGEGIKEIS